MSDTGSDSVFLSEDPECSVETTGSPPATSGTYFAVSGAIILKVYLDAAATRVTEVPITPHTTVGDVLQCCREPGEETCHLAELWRGIERPVTEEERPYEILQQWGIHRDEVRFFLRHELPMPAVDNDSRGRVPRRAGRNGMTGDGLNDNGVLPHGVDLTLAELQEMAARQQQQIEAQQQLLVAKEQRLRFLKQQELRHEQIAAENERLRKLREKVEAQELKLKKLRALRGQVSEHKGNNNNLTAELEMIKSLFNEKEKELSLAVGKVEELTKQLEELRNGRVNGFPVGDNRNNSPASLELEKLRKELMVRNKLNEAQNSKLAAHREVMQQRKEEMTKMDVRIAELQQRLRKNRNLQQQQQQQQQHPQDQQQYSQQGITGQRGGSLNAKIGTNRPLSANIAAVEPYIKHGSNKDAVIDQHGNYNLSKQDPKYQTLPPNIKLLGLEGKRLDGGEPNGNMGMSMSGGEKGMDNGHLEKNNNTYPPPAHPYPPQSYQDGLKVDTGNTVGDVSGPGSPGKSGKDLLPKEVIHKVPDYKPSKGHTTAFNVMEEVLKKSEKGDGISSVQAPSSTSNAPRGVYGPSAYKPPSSLSNFTARPFGSTYSTAMLANRPSVISTLPTQSPTTTTSSVSSPGALFPKTSTPISGGHSQGSANAGNQDDMREIFITGAPMTSPSASFTGRSPLYTTAASGGPSGNLYPPLSVATTGVSGGPAGEVSPHGRQGEAGKQASHYQIASSRPQQPMQPQRASDPPSPPSTSYHLPSSSLSSSSRLPSSQAPAISNKLNSSSSTSSGNFPGIATTTSSSNEGRPSAPGQISLSTSTKVTLSERHALGQNRDSSTNSGSNQGTNGSAYQPSQTIINSANSSNSGSTIQGPNHVSQGSFEEKHGKIPSSPTDRDSKKEITANSVSSALSVLMSGPTTTTATTRPFRYAPKSVIANTYMRKLGSNTLDEYRKTMNQIYKDFTPATATTTVPSTTTDSVSGIKDYSPDGSPVHRGIGEGDQDIVEGLRPSDLSPNSQHRPSSPRKTQEGYGSREEDGPPGSPSHLPPSYRGAPSSDIDAERLRYKPNAPKTLRRRLSSGESDDLARFLPSQQKQTISPPSEAETKSPEQPSNSGGPTSQNVVRVDTIQDSYNNNTPAYSDDLVVPPPYDTPHGDGKALPTNIPPQPATKENKPAVIRRKKTNLKTKGSVRSSRRVSFDPLALLLDASLEGELELVKRTAGEVADPSAANDEGITALHNAICAGHYDIVKFLTEFGCNVNAPDSDGWTPLHCAASCNNLAMVKLLVEHGACIFATTISDHETAAEKCEEDEDGYDGCSEYLYSVQEKLGIINKGVVYAVFDYKAQNPDELSFQDADDLTVLRKGDDQERDWWWARRGDREGYIPRNLLGSYPRVPLQSQREASETNQNES